MHTKRVEFSHEYCREDKCILGGPCRFIDPSSDYETATEIFDFPLHMEVCPRCDGHGTTDHPAFSNGISPEQFDEDPDFCESYFSGVYDVPCPECRGLRVVEELDTDEATERQIEAWYWLAHLHDPSPEEIAERRYFASFQRD